MYIVYTYPPTPPPPLECLHPLEKRFPDDGDSGDEPLMRETPPEFLSKEEAVVSFSVPVAEADGNGAVSKCMQKPQTRLLHTCVT